MLIDSDSDVSLKLDSVNSLKQSLSLDDSIVQFKEPRKSIFHPSSSTFKLIIIFSISTANIGLNFCVDNPIVLQNQIMNIIGLSATKYDMLITFTALPNIIMAILSGILIDNLLNIKYSLILFIFINTIGQIVFAVGAVYNLFWLMIIGRLLFGTASESIQVASNKFAGIWLNKNWLIFFYSIYQIFGKIGEFGNMYFMVDIYEYFEKHFYGHSSNYILGFTLGVGVLVCIFSLLMSIITSITHTAGTKIASSSTDYVDFETPEKFKWSSFKEFNVKFWIITLIVGLSYSATTSFNSLTLSYYIEKYQLKNTLASHFQSIYTAVSMVSSPIFGVVSGHIGYVLPTFVAATVLSLFSQTLLLFTFIPIYVFVVPYGISTSIRNLILWPMISYTVSKNRLGLAFGTAQSIQNLFLTLSPILAGTLFDGYGGSSFIMYIDTLFIATLTLAFILRFVDATSKDPVLSVNSNQLAKHQVERELDEQILN